MFSEMQILAVTVQEKVGQFHPVLVHFPIVLFTTALVTDLLNYFGKTKALVVGHWLVIAGVISCMPTLFTGLAAAAGFDPGDALVEEHRFMGFATAVTGSLYAGLRISVMWWKLNLRPFYYLVMSVILVSLVAWTSDYGGLITHGETPFSALRK